MSLIRPCQEINLHYRPVLAAGFTVIAVALCTIAALGCLGYVPGLNTLGNSLLFANSFLYALAAVGFWVRPCQHRAAPVAQGGAEVTVAPVPVATLLHNNEVRIQKSKKEWKPRKQDPIDKSGALSLQTLPEELLQLVFKQCTSKEWARCAKVSTVWRRYFFNHLEYGAGLAMTWRLDIYGKTRYTHQRYRCDAYLQPLNRDLYDEVAYLGDCHAIEMLAVARIRAGGEWQALLQILVGKRIQGDRVYGSEVERSISIVLDNAIYAMLEKGHYKEAFGQLDHYRDDVRGGEAAEKIVAYLCLANQLQAAEGVADAVKDEHCRYCGYLSVALAYAERGDMDSVERVLGKKAYKNYLYTQRAAIDIGAAQLALTGSCSFAQKQFSEPEWPYMEKIVRSRAALRLAVANIGNSEEALEAAQTITGSEDKITFYAAFGRAALEAGRREDVVVVVDLALSLITDFRAKNDSSWHHDRTGILERKQIEDFKTLLFLLAEYEKHNEAKQGLLALMQYYKSSRSFFSCLVKLHFFPEAFRSVAEEENKVEQFKMLKVIEDQVLTIAKA